MLDGCNTLEVLGGRSPTPLKSERIGFVQSSQFHPDYGGQASNSGIRFGMSNGTAKVASAKPAMLHRL